MSYGSKFSRPVTYRIFQNPVFWEGRQIWTWLGVAVIQKYKSHLVIWNVYSQEHPYIPEVLQNEESAICREWVEVRSWFPMLFPYIHRGHKFIQAIKLIVVSPAWLCLTLSWRRPFSYRNQSIDLLCKSMDWFLYDNSLRHERLKVL